MTEARDCGSDDGRGVEDRRAERDGVHQVAPADHLDHEGLAGWDVEHVDGAGHERRDDHHPVLRVPGRAHSKQHERGRHESDWVASKTFRF
jgi:hypothetical protein